MRIERVIIKGFGRLVEREYEFPKDRAALVLESNESGKSTLAAAIFAALCGFPARKQRGELVKQSDIYAPWHSENYCVIMDIEADGRRLRIERDFAKASFIVRDRDTNRDISASFDSDLAYHFLRLSRDDFRRIAFISGKEAPSFGSSPDIQARLSALVDGSQDDSGADRAIKSLLDAKYPLEGKSIKTETAATRLNKAIEEKRRRMRELDASLDAAGEEAHKLDEAQSRHSELSERYTGLDNEYRASRLREVREAIHSASATATEVSDLQTELESLEPFANFPLERSESLSKSVERLKERTAQLRELQDSLKAAHAQADDFRTQLDTMEQFAAADEEDHIRLSMCESELRNAQNALRKKQEEVEKEQRVLAAEGVDLARAVEAEAKFGQASEDDRSLLRSYGELEARESAEISSAEAAALQAEQELGSIKQKRASAHRTGTAVLGVGLLFGIISLFMMILGTINVVASAAGMGASVIIAAYGAMQFAKSTSMGADEKARLERNAEDAQSRMQCAKVNHREIEQRLSRLAGKLGFEDPREMLYIYKEHDKASGRSDTMNSLRAQLMQANVQVESVKERAVSVLRRLGVQCNANDDLPDALSRTRDSLANYLSIKRKRMDAERDISALSRSVQDKETGVMEEKSIINSILTDAGIDNTLPLDEALSRFKESESRCRRYRQIKDVLIPAAMKHASPDDALAKLREEEADLVRQLAGSSVIDAARSSSEVESDRQSVRREMDNVLGEVRELEKRVGALVDTYHRDYSPLQEELESLEREAEKAQRFGRAIDIAARVMKECAESSHRRWAAALNEQAGKILPHLNPDYTDLRFDDSLGFTVRHISDDRIIEKAGIDNQLSTGAKDQIYLAVRLACCAELSKLGESIPIILDDPLIAADDERFRQGFRYLVETLAKDRQVIILSCHESRHKQLSSADWFTEHTAVLEL